MKKLAFLGGAAGLGLLALLNAPLTQAADHADVAALAATNPMADINDLYAWMTSDGAKINLALTVSPFDDGTNEFGPSVQYVFHLRRYNEIMTKADFPVSPEQIAAGEESKVICTFTSNTAGKCWLVDPANKVLDYVEGDLSGATGKASVGGKFRAFAGPRSDPFFFNLAGFATAQHKIQKVCGGGTPGTCPGVLTQVPMMMDAAGCPKGLSFAQTSAVAADLAQQQNGQPTPDPDSVLPPGCSATEIDCFKGKNVVAIAIQLDKDLIVTDAKPILSIYGSTHAGQ